jgi:glycosyltransferase involved in cell wall biosynthesis
MQKYGKIVVVSRHYPPDSTTTAVYLAAIAEGLAIDNEVIVLSGSPNSARKAGAGSSKPIVIEIKNWTPPKHALIRRALSISLVAFRMFFSTLTRTRRHDVVFCVTTPFTVPYAAILAARLRGAATVLLIYDLYPEALERAGLIKPRSLASRLIRFANAVLFRSLDAIVTIGRDVEALLLPYRGVKQERIHFIPNWTLLPHGYREIRPDNRFRAGRDCQLIVGLSGNLGFTHDPKIVFEAARLIERNNDVHLILSGWGIGWDRLCQLQMAAGLKNVTLLDPVPEAELVEFLSSADVWIIPYRRNITGVSIPSRLYNLLAVGRAIIVAAEPDSEAALVVNEEGIGWIVPPEDPHRLADAICLAASDRMATVQKGRRAAEAAEKYSQQTAIARYRELILDLQTNNSRQFK